MSESRKNRPPSGPPASKITLSEALVKQALESLDWKSLQAHLEDRGLSRASLTFLLGHLRRTSSIILEYPNARREARRTEFFNELKGYVRRVLGAKAVKALSAEIVLLDQVECGYRGILDEHGGPMLCSKHGVRVTSPAD